MNEEKTLFKITRKGDGVEVEVHCESNEEILNVAKSIVGVALEDDMFCWTLLLSLRHAFSEQGKKEYEEHTVEMPDFNELLKKLK